MVSALEFRDSWFYLIFFEKYSIWRYKFQLSSFQNWCPIKDWFCLRKFHKKNTIGRPKRWQKNRMAKCFLLCWQNFQHPLKSSTLLTYSARSLANLIPILNLLSWESSCADSNRIFFSELYPLKGEFSWEIFFHDYSRPNLTSYNWQSHQYIIATTLPSIYNY